MEAQRWLRVSALFDELVEQSEAERAHALDRIRTEDPELAAQVAALLHHVAAGDDEADDLTLLGAPARVAAHWADDEESTEGIGIKGRRVGPWRIVREIGRGGMGVVFLAERADGQFEQRAALKLIRTDDDSVALRRRFLRERQILARLDHANIARLLDGGIAEDGRPYFAMEYVDGQPLLDYVAERDSSLKTRLGLFVDVCNAVQFAHRQLIVHRDIKPSNVLITVDGTSSCSTSESRCCSTCPRARTRNARASVHARVRRARTVARRNHDDIRRYLFARRTPLRALERPSPLSDRGRRAAGGVDARDRGSHVRSAERRRRGSAAHGQSARPTPARAAAARARTARRPGLDRHDRAAP